MFLQISLAVVTIVTYALFFNPSIALGLFGLLAIHEYGHVVGLKITNISYEGPYFIPFLGAIIVPQEQHNSMWDEFVFVYLGPLFGLFSVGLSIGLYYITHNMIFMAIGFLAAFINLMNLIPVFPLDGGRLTRSIFTSISNSKASYFILAGIGGIFISLCVFFHFWVFSIFGVLGLFQIRNEYYNAFYAQITGNAMQKMSVQKIITTTLLYGALVLILLYCVIYTGQIVGLENINKFFE